MQNQLPDLEDIPPSEEKCAYQDCEKEAAYRCTACSGALYCSPEHQETHWTEHLASCCPVRLEKNDTLGRYMVATRGLSPGEVIIAEDALVVGPKQGTPPICLSCYRTVDGSYRCTLCGFPMCGVACQDHERHKGECELFASRAPQISSQITDFTSSCPVYECIMPLRCLLLKDTDPTSWEAISIMEDHREIRSKQIDIWQANQVNVVDFLRSQLGLVQFEEEEIHRIIGVLEVNCFEIRGRGFSVRGVYPRAAIMAHECVYNTSHVIETKGHRMVIRASIAIQKGSLVTITYTHTLQGTYARRQHLLQSKFFRCICRRCADPSELGTNMSSLKCARCVPGLVLPQDPLDDSDTAQWLCHNCDFHMNSSAVNKIVDVIEAETNEANNDILKLEETLKRFSPALHPKHWLMLNIKHSLSQMYGRVIGYVLDDLPDMLLERKIELCREILSVADVIDPGFSRLRGVTLYELHAPIVLLANRLFQYGEIGQEELRERLLEARRYLSAAAQILSLEDPETPEGQMAAAASSSMLQLEHCIDAIDEM